MKKELKNYLHLYLGCEIVNYPYSGLTVDERKDCTVIGILKSVLGEKVFIQNKDINGHNWGHLTTDSILAVKPILRPLSDMTEDEENEIEGEYGSYGLGEKHLCNALKNHDLRYVKKLDEAFDLTHYLISKHFDIFGLIEAGIAVDKSKVTQLKSFLK